MRTLGRQIIHLDPPQGFAAEATAAAILYVAGLSFGAPISTTHTITSSIMGVGATKRLSAVRWGVAGNIVGAWIFTFPGAALVAALGLRGHHPLPVAPGAEARPVHRQPLARPSTFRAVPSPAPPTPSRGAPHAPPLPP